MAWTQVCCQYDGSYAGFLTCSGRAPRGLKVSEDGLLRHLVALERPALAQPMPEQLSLFGP